MTKKLIKLLASDVDFQSRLKPADRIEVFFSQPDGDDRMSEDSELLYVSATFGGNTRNFYRFQMPDGTIDYFDEDGRSAKQFLLRNPLPNGNFRSGFGSRHHPILGYSKMHTGVDWAAPAGSPIIAAGNGVVEKAGWAGGYGRQTIIRHANGYETSYNHQSRDRQRRQARRPGQAGPGHRLCRHDRPVDGRPPALRTDGQQPQGRPDARQAAGRPRPQGQGARDLRARARAHRRTARRTSNADPLKVAKVAANRRLELRSAFARPLRGPPTIPRHRHPRDERRKRRERGRHPGDRGEGRVACRKPNCLEFGAGRLAGSPKLGTPAVSCNAEA